MVNPANKNGPQLVTQQDMPRLKRLLGIDSGASVNLKGQSIINGNASVDSRYQVGFSGSLSGKSTGNIQSAIDSLLGIVAPGSPHANCAYTCMAVYDKAFGKGTAENLGLHPKVSTAAAQMESNRLWQKITDFSGYVPKPGDIATSRKNGHMVISDGTKFLGANESQRKTLDKSYYQVEAGNIDVIYRLVEDPFSSTFA